jgi:peptide/nickel transport system substrate-binding protein
MKKWSKVLATTSVVAIAMGAVAGCGSQATSSSSNTNQSSSNTADNSKPVDGGSVTLQTPSTPDEDLNPDIQNSEYDQWVYVQPAFEKLLNEQADGTYTPALAKSYDISPDKKTVTFHLRDDAKWSDGQPITADDVVFTYNVTATKEYQDILQGPITTTNIVGYDKLNSKNSFADMVAGKVSLDGVKKIDDHTVSVTFNQPIASMLYQANQIYPIPKHIWSKIPIEQWKQAEQDLKNFVCSGPFKLTDMKQKEYYTLERNDNYYGNRAHLDKITWKVVPSQTAAGELKNGELDMVAWPAPTDLPLYNSIPNLNHIEVPSWSFQYLGFNCSSQYTNDKALRQAIAYSIDRDAIIKALFQGHAGKMDFPVALQSFAYPKSGEVPTYNYDPAKAKQILKDAGYKQGPDGKWLGKDGKPMKLTLSYPKGNPTREKAAPMYVDFMQKIGLDVTLNPPKDFASYFADIKNGNFQMYLIGSDFTTVDPDQTGQWGEHDPANYNRWVNKESDRLVADSISEKAFDINYRRNAMIQWEKVFSEDLPEFVLYNEHDSYYWNKRLHGVKEDNRVFDIFYDFENWWVDKK